jgi:hypothetical protein
MVIEAPMRQTGELHQVDNAEPFGTVLAQAVGGTFNDAAVGLTSVAFCVSHRYFVQAPKVTGCTNRSHPRAILEPRTLEGGGNISLQCRLSYMIIVI